MDPGWVYNEELIATGNHSYLSGDNGFSFSRGNRKVTITNNTSELAAQAGIYVGGYISQLASTDLTVTGNVVITPGGVGISLIDAPMRGTISSNTINKGYQMGTSDSPDTTWQYAIMVRGEPSSGSSMLTNPTAYATYLNITGNTIYQASRGGIYLTGCHGVLVSGNIIGDTGDPNPPYYPPPSGLADPTWDVGILVDHINNTLPIVDNVAIFNNVILDQRPTTVLYYGVYPPQAQIPSSVGIAANNYAPVCRAQQAQPPQPCN